MALLLIKLSFNLVGHWERPAGGRLCVLIVCGIVDPSRCHELCVLRCRRSCYFGPCSWIAVGGTLWPSLPSSRPAG